MTTDSFLILLFLLFGCFSCSNVTKKDFSKEESITEFQMAFPTFEKNKISTRFILPNRISENSTEEMPFQVNEVFKNHLSTYYFNVGGDSAESYFTLKELFVASFFISVNPDCELYFMLTKNPTSQLSIYGVMFNPTLQKLAATSIIQDLSWSYNYENNMIINSNLTNGYDPISPFIEITDIDFNGRNEIEIQRIAHNGTAYTAVDNHFYEISDTSLNLVFSYSKIEDISMDDTKITRELAETAEKNTLKLVVLIEEKNKETIIGSVIYKRSNPNQPYVKAEHILNKELTSEQACDWGKLLVNSYSHGLHLR